MTNKRDELARIMSEWSAEIDAILERAAFEELGILSDSATNRAIDAILDALMEPGEGALEAGAEEFHRCTHEPDMRVNALAAKNILRAILTHRKGKP